MTQVRVKQLIGYLLQDSVSAGGTLEVAVDSQGREFSARLVRLGGPRDTFGRAPWWSSSPVEGCVEIPNLRAAQQTRSGSFGCSEPVEALIGPRGLSLTVWFWQSAVAAGTLLSQTWDQGSSGLNLGLTASGHVEFRIWTGERSVSVRGSIPAAANIWQAVALSVDPAERRIHLSHAKSSPLGVTSLVDRQSVAAELPTMPLILTPIGIGSSLETDGSSAGDIFEGKIDHPRIWGTCLSPDDLNEVLLGGEIDSHPAIEWLFGPVNGLPVQQAEVPNQRGCAPRLTLVNNPQVAVTGHRWKGTTTDFRLAPPEYSAVRFHADDLADAGWETTFTLPVPEALQSGIYAVELSCGQERDHIPVYVRPRLDQRTESKVLYIAPTMTYLAYGNDRQHRHADFGGMTAARANGPYEDWIDAHPELGSSLYDLHPDGAGWSYSARRRPLGNVRPDYVSWITGYPRHFSADLAIVSWLRHTGIRFDVITDHDLHRDGGALLEHYAVVVTGSHPEYVSGRMLDALATYTARNGRLMYLGGNGFYWVTGVAEDGSIEVRRGHAGTRSSESLPGEDVLSLTAEPGGLWRHRGRSPNHLTGVGFAAQGWTGGVPYVVADDLPKDLHKLIFGDLAPGARVGAFGSMGGAAGDEVDRFDVSLGSPDTSVVLASSERFDDTYQPAVEDHPTITPTVGGSTNRDVRADMTYVRHDTGGAVFSVGSINWAMCLPVNGFDNDVAAISTNVLKSFVDGAL
ncbi:MAG TPA: N,N-dimethylformamidase beta subunit family domain-containing protein [Micromonosporaceae bacterium]|nr:N,N-dimethylformamidase beta subunit family domain-containing protein [Micromonosporaceae bacterium]